MVRSQYTGIPVVFPCFGPPERPDHVKLAQHGFAQNETWTFDSVATDNDAGVAVRLRTHEVFMDHCTLI
jgi:glucose-6-phosphate 1-epimerase